MKLAPDESACACSDSQKCARRCRFYFAGALLLGVVLFSAMLASGTGYACAQQPVSPKRASADASAAGKKLFDGNCAGCHGLDARGGEHAPNIATNPEVRRMADEELFRVVHDGAASGTMPAFGSTLSDAK